MLVILNFCGFLLFLFAKSVQAVFLGPLRETEIKACTHPPHPQCVLT